MIISYISRNVKFKVRAIFCKLEGKISILVKSTQTILIKFFWNMAQNDPTKTFMVYYPSKIDFFLQFWVGVNRNTERKVSQDRSNLHEGYYPTCSSLHAVKLYLIAPPLSTIKYRDEQSSPRRFQ